MEAMHDFAITSSMIHNIAFDAVSAVEDQKRMMAVMRSGDPGLPFANVMLGIMKQNAETAKMNLVFYPPPKNN